jgi:Fe(3+) dicitrate transport protein
LFGNLSTALIGVRLFNGFTRQRQGDADSGAEPNFQFLNPDNLENSDFRFPSRNYSVFVEHIFAISPSFSITPGARLERIETDSRGYFRTIVRNSAGDVISDSTTVESLSRPRSFMLFGVGASYQTKIGIEFYANASQNYRAVNFTDLRVANLNFKVDENIQDESGYSLDLGARGNFDGWLYFDATLFYLKYNNRIGLNTTKQTPVRTNIGDARIFGIETLVELDVLKLLRPESKIGFSIFSNLAILNAKYVRSDEPAFRNRDVELAPALNLRTGATLRRKPFQATIQYAFTSKQFSDATNAETFPTAVYGAIPAYGVMDFAASCKGSVFLVETGVNNLLNTRYFTRRAESYPGPGIIPSDARSFYLTLGASF